MKTPEEIRKIRKGLKVCRKQYDGMHWISCHLDCPYKADGVWCEGVLHADALAYIQQLESRLAQVERERDAAVHDMENYAGYGAICKHFDEDCPHVEGCPLWPSDCESYEWRGVCSENSKEE